MYGKQYRFNALSQPGYWVLEKVHRTQRDVRNSLGRMETVVQERVVDVFVVVERKVMKCSTLYDLANVRMVCSPPRPVTPPSLTVVQLGAVHSLTTTLTRLRTKTPAPNVRTTTFWQSATLKVPDETIPSHTPTIPETATPTPAAAKRRKRPDPYQMTILHAMQTTQNAIPGLLGTQGEGKELVRTTEEEQADRFMRIISAPVAAGDGVRVAAGGGVKRTVDEAVRGVAKQARFQV